MIKIFVTFTILTVMISTAAVYNLKQGTYDLEEEKRNISAQILKDREAIKVLKAEMAYLSRPERIERLSRRHLALETASNDQMVATVTTLTKRENVQVVSLPVDNFQLLLPRQKPNPNAKSSYRPAPSNTERVVAIDYSQKQQQQELKQEEKNETKSLYERILAKIGN
ncbi:cell division protein FtsL [Pseudemcibacter aquimaris]|uniref:cell division protein FtsL n=1 Tax=Pseudemcibacter aquimaris TaxID=2857064 RepID=UPI002012EB65|nr:hypothetical protein [Pseudemcibacter aquimaris]MCC3861374.1 hypothetical protein [Pseudemcibacter aquimaris]WDU58146.1 hypothetical protein KW060_13195 [Pseudemcibacter aquimaris]